MRDLLLGVVIPTLNEAAFLPRLLDELSRLPFACDIVVADGGSTDGTRKLAEHAGVRVVCAPRGRALQMNRGAAELETPWLLFLHADTRLTAEAGVQIRRWLSRPQASEGGCSDGGERAAHFGFGLDGDGLFWRFLEWGQLLRERVSGLVYGDQGLLVSSKAFRAVGGFEAVPLMEDVRMIRALRKRGRVERLPARILTSPRRYEREGRWRGFLRNAALISLHGLRFPPRLLARFYAPEVPSAGRTLMVFAKAPVAGTVKTRLAAGIGAEAATDLYRRMGRAIVDRVRSGAHRTVILYDPPDALPEMREWLGSDGLEFRPQETGDLGRRLNACFTESLRDPGTSALVIGTDVPGLTLMRIEEAFAALERGDWVVGPAEDGGYYLLGLNRPAPSLFTEIEWSTPSVLEETRARANRLGLREITLPPLRDIDTVADLRAEPHLLSGIVNADPGVYPLAPIE